VNGGDNAINVKSSLPLELFDAVHVGRKSRRTGKKPRSRAWSDRERLLTGEFGCASVKLLLPYAI